MVLLYIGPGAGLALGGSFLILLGAIGVLLLLILTWPLRFLLALLWKPLDRRKASIGRVVVVGLDGLDPGRLRRLMQQGRVPQMARLAEEGTFAELQTTLPPMSPVAWSSFQTGVNPGKHGIFDFLARDLRTYLPELSSVRIRERPTKWWQRLLGWQTASIQMRRKSQPFWKVLGQHRVFSTILRVPISFPPEPFFGLSLSAMCTPDLRGTQGSFTLLTTDPSEVQSTTGGMKLLLEQQSGYWTVSLPGPTLPMDTSSGRQLAVPIKIRRRPKTGEVELIVHRERIIFSPEKPSGWQTIAFRQGPLRTIHGVCEFRIASLEPHLRIYVSPIQIDPGRPVMPVSHPPLYSIYLRKLHGLFATLGLAEDTWGLNSGAMSEADFLEQAWTIHDERERMLFETLKTTRTGLIVCVFDGPDRIQHMFYRHDVPDHPANLVSPMTATSSVIDEMYVRMDELVGRVSATLNPHDVLIVLSDHGFCEFRRGVNLNAWLRDEGYLQLLPEAKPGDWYAGVDWSRTKAYAFGLNGVCLNMAGRESQGIVPPVDVPALKRELQQKLAAIVDPATGHRAIRAVYDAQQEYHGPYVSTAPDLIPGYEAGYRVSWESVTGRVEGDVFVDNTHRWSGDHCVDPAIVPGVILTNRRLSSNHPPALLDLAPTILNLFGVPIPAYMDGKAFHLAAAGSATASSDHTPSPPVKALQEAVPS